MEAIHELPPHPVPLPPMGERVVGDQERRQFMIAKRECKSMGATHEPPVRSSGFSRYWLGLFLGVISLPLCAQPFRFPTANESLLESNGEERFFVGTVGKSWTSGSFGCVRSEGRQLHEGLD